MSRRKKIQQGILARDPEQIKAVYATWPCRTPPGVMGKLLSQWLLVRLLAQLRDRDALVSELSTELSEWLAAELPSTVATLEALAAANPLAEKYLIAARLSFGDAMR